MDNSIKPWYEAASVGTNYYSMNVFKGDGGDTFEINFAGGYLSREHIRAYMQKGGDTKVEILTLTFISDARVRTSKPVPVGYTVVIYRDTPKVTPLVSFVDGAPQTASNLDRNAMQAVFAAAEMVDRYDSTVANIGDIGQIVTDFDTKLNELKALVATVSDQITTAKSAVADTSYQILAGKTSALHLGLTKPNTALSIKLETEVPTARLTLILRQDTGTNKVTWANNIKWCNGNPPPLSWTQGAQDIFELMTFDGGSSWFGNFSGGWF